jgi:hypothetical protein
VINGRYTVRHFVFASLMLPLVLLIAAAPVVADTGFPPGTTFSSDSTVCASSGGLQVCTVSSLGVNPNGDGTESACLSVQTYSILSTGRFNYRSREFGCAPAGTLIVGADLSVAFGPTDIALSTCNRRACTLSRTVTVSANDTPTSAALTTTTRTTTMVGGCTYRTATTEQDADLAGTLMINATALDETGFVSVVDQTTTVHCH